MRLTLSVLPLLLPIGLLGCARTSPAADAELNDALPWLLANFDGDSEEIAEVLLAMEAKTYLTLDLDGSEPDRSVEQSGLTEEHLANIEHPGVPLDTMAAMTVGHLSPFQGDDHAGIVLMPNQVPVEPYSPDKYDRSFLEGEDCWLTRGCETIRTENDLIKKNALMQVGYVFNKDFRWINLADDDDPRWAVIGLSYMKESATGDGGKATIVQSYSIEYTIPRDGRGFLLADVELPEDSVADYDSDGEGTLRMQALWTETTFTNFTPGENMVKGTVRGGIIDNYDAADEFLAEQAGE